MKFQLMSRAAVAALAAGGAAASGDDKDAGPAPGEGGTDKPAEQPTPTPSPTPTPAPTEQPATDPAPEATQAVVAAADAQALIAEADGKGFARANARMTTVFASDEGKANPSLAAFMLANSTAEAPAIIEQLKAQGPAQAPEAAAPPARTIANTGVDIGVDPKALAEDKGAAAEADAGWDAALGARSAANAPLIPVVAPAANGGHVTTMPAITRTGN